jgi:hypothetical protein
VRWCRRKFGHHDVNAIDDMLDELLWLNCGGPL